MKERFTLKDKLVLENTITTKNNQQ